MAEAGESVKVAVRVRPFNQREKDRGAKLIIEMSGAQTRIKNPDTKDEPKMFAFDFSYWSHDGYTEQPNGVLEAKPGSKYASQQRVFDDLGKGVLDNAFKGFNCSLFAYGQTGSGKSYSMVGYGENKGIVPITCDELFKTMAKGNSDVKYQITFSMLEIYNEQVRDLLQKNNPKGGLQVRQNPKLGLFYVQDLKKVAVGSYQEIEKRIAEGTANRTVASTNMNATSSRAHTVVTIIFEQISKNEAGQETKKSSTINLVDLAGSERADSTGATGDRLKEGANINKSLSALGNVISALADLSMGKKKIMVPYRDSVLTKLLQNALGGNSKTVMIAALSPADINYDETLSTLRYADRAKKIKNKAVVNENPLDKMIRELREENEKLKKALAGGGAIPIEGGSGMSPEEREKMRREMEEEIRAQLTANQEALDMGSGWEEKMKRDQAEYDAENREKTMAEERKNKEPHFMNLNEDPLLSGMIVYFVSASKTTIGRKDADPVPTITLSGLSIQKNHAVITNEGGEVTLQPGGPGAKIKVNGAPLTGPRTLEHLDRVLFGSSHMYVFKNPLKPKKADGTPDHVDWDFAQTEIAQAKGFATGGMAGLTKDQQRAQEQVLEILPLVTEANAMSEELNKHKSFEVILISGAAQEGAGKETKVMVKMKNLLNGNTWLWERGKFMNRRYLMQDMYQRWLDGDEDVMKIPKEEDPFWEPTEDVLIGSCNAFLQSLGYALDFDDSLAVTDYKGTEEGQMSIVLTPSTQAGKPLDEEMFVDDPQELLGKPFYFKVTVRNCDVNKARYSKGLFVKYRVFNEAEYTQTPTLKGSLSPEWNHSRIVSFPSVTKEHLDYFDSGCITFLLYGVQEDVVPDSKLVKMSTKELREMESKTQRPGLGPRRSTSFGLDSSGDGTQLKAEFVLLQRKYERLEKKERRMQEICREWESKPSEQQQFEPFFRAVSAVAYSTGTKLKTRVHLLNQMLRGHQNAKERLNPDGNDDVISIVSFNFNEQLEQTEEVLQKGSKNGDTVKKRGHSKTQKGDKQPAENQSKACIVM